MERLTFAMTDRLVARGIVRVANSVVCATFQRSARFCTMIMAKRRWVDGKSDRSS